MPRSPAIIWPTNRHIGVFLTAIPGGISLTGYRVQLRDTDMRKISFGMAAVAAGFFLSAAPAFAYTVYELRTDDGPASHLSGQEPQIGTSTTRDGNSNSSTVTFGPNGSAQFTTTTNGGELSRDTNWQGTGYYLRPDR